MNKADSLIRGVGVVIDDHVFDLISKNAADRCAESFEGKGVLKKDIVAVKSKNRKTYTDDIIRIVKALESAGIPLIKYDRVPADPEALMENISGVSFVLLDWSFQKIDIAADGILGVRSQGVGEDDQRFVIEFIKRVLELCVVPIFVFCNEPRDARRKLTDELGDEAVARLLIMGKSAVASKVINTIKKWYSATPSTYVLKVWDNIYRAARRKMFRDFSQASLFWPASFFKAYENDDDDPAAAFTELLLRNLRGRMSNVPLKKGPMMRKGPLAANSVIRSVLELSVITPVGSLAEEGYGCGDLYVSEDLEGRLYQLNVRCDCDLCHDKNPDFLLLNGREVKLPEVIRAKRFSRKDGLNRPLHGAYVFPVDQGRCVFFKFNDYKRVKAKTFLKPNQSNPSAQPKRIGRMLPPYITDIRQRNAQWMQREGFPKIPIQAFK